MQYFLQRDDVELWEEVDEYTFQNRSNVVFDGQSEDNRYNDNFIRCEGAVVDIQYSGNPKGLAIILRMLGVNPSVSERPGGICQTPENVVLKKGKSTFLHHINGETYKLSKVA